jgi:hypothetical protein
MVRRMGTDLDFRHKHPGEMLLWDRIACPAIEDLSLGALGQGALATSWIVQGTISPVRPLESDERLSHFYVQSLARPVVQSVSAWS